MADLVAADVTYTERAGYKRATGGTRVRFVNKVRSQFGDAAKTYPAGGVPLTVGKLGFRAEVTAIGVVVNAPAGVDVNPIWIWNGSTTAPKLQGFEVNRGAPTAGDVQLTELDAGSDAPAAQDLELLVEGF